MWIDNMSNYNNFFVSNSVLEKCENWLKRFPEDKKRSAVIEVLKIVQEENGGYLTNKLIENVANYLNIPEISVYEVATFYGMYDLEKVGKYKLYLCVSISCMLCGSDDLVLYIKKKLGINFNQTTKDGKFTLKKAECLAACGGAPVMIIGDKYYENLTPSKIDLILDGLE